MAQNMTEERPLRLGAIARPVVLLAGEESFVGLLKYVLEHDNFVCHYAKNGGLVVSLAEQCKPDLIALDSSLGQGAELACQELAGNVGTRDIPVVMLIAPGEDVERLSTRDVRAAEYLFKPFVPGKLMATFRSMLQPPQATGTNGIISFSDIRMDVKAHRIFRNRREVHVGPIEFRLLQYLINHPCQVFSRRQLLECVWGRDIHVVLRTVDVHMSRLRKALNDRNETDYIRTVRAIGYSLDT
jgi:two-component system phosphate regulon response regulator PhoB